MARWVLELEQLDSGEWIVRASGGPGAFFYIGEPRFVLNDAVEAALDAIAGAQEDVRG